MSTKRSRMCNETSIQDLPDEMLEKILLYLSVYDRRPALRVCRRWSTVIPLSSVLLVVNFKRNRTQEAYRRTLLASSRQYKHLVLYFGENSSKNELLVEIVQHFSHKMETLKIESYYSVPIEQMLITQILSLCFNLRHLHIDSCKIDSGSHDLEISPMHKLEELYLGYNLLPNMSDITPNITRLHMENHHYSVEAEMFLRHFSSQLVELNIVFRSKDYFLTVCRMQFPLLEKLNFHCTYVENNPGNLLEIADMFDLFFLHLPLLKEVTLRFNLNERVLQNLCRSCVNMQFLCVRLDYLSQDSFRVICELKHLKHLRIVGARVNVPPDMCSPQTNLQKLTLHLSYIGHPAEFNSFVQYAMPNLAVMELLDLSPNYVIDVVRSFKMHEQFFSKIPSLQRLVISQPDSDIMLGQFLEFCASYAPKELRFRCKEILDIPENVTPSRIPVQKLILDSPLISPSVLKKLISSMEELRWLEILVTDNLLLEVIGSLREQFPRCYVVAKRTVVIEET